MLEAWISFQVHLLLAKIYICRYSVKYSIACFDPHLHHFHIGVITVHEHIFPGDDDVGFVGRHNFEDSRTCLRKDFLDILWQGKIFGERGVVGSDTSPVSLSPHVLPPSMLSRRRRRAGILLLKDVAAIGIFCFDFC